MRLTTWARQALTEEEQAELEKRAEQLDVTLGAIYSARHGQWNVTARSRRNRTRMARLRGVGPLSAVLAGVLDDYDQLLYTPEELAVIQKQSNA